VLIGGVDIGTIGQFRSGERLCILLGLKGVNPECVSLPCAGSFASKETYQGL
jgi:hypothetical protein